MVAAIPTTYKHIRFRSRTEAKWACFFDLVGWRWDYEPYDLSGYIPDFVLHLKSQTLLEVKPELELGDLKTYREKIERSGWDKDAVIVGAKVFDAPHNRSFDGFYPPILGHILREEICLSDDDWKPRDSFFVRAWDLCPLLYCKSCDSPTFVTRHLNFECAICGAGSPVGDNVRPLYEAIELWKQAMNEVQWMKPL
jgi:hypothetical protein